MAVKLLALILTLFLLTGCQSDTAGEVSQGGATAPQSFDTAPTVSDIFPANIVEDTQSNWIYLVYSDEEGHVATSCQISNRSYVNVTSACSCSFGTCKVKVTGFENYEGPVSFTYSVTANNQTSQLAVASFNITGVSEAPVAVPTAFSVPESTVYTSNGTTKAHLQGIDPDGDTVTCIKETDPTNGAVTVNADCSFVYTPTVAYEGTDSFTFKVDDGFFVSAPVTVSITVTKVNVAPVTTGSSNSTYQNVALPFTLGATDADGDPLIYYIITAPIHGTLSGTNGAMTYTPATNHLGTDNFTFMVFDGTENSNISVVYISTVTPTLFLSAAGNDATAVINDPALPYLTAQAAADAITAYAPTAARPLIVDVGAGSFGDITVTQDFGYYVTWQGASAATSIIGNITAVGSDGAPGVAVGDPELGDYDGEDGTNGKNIFLTTDYNITFGNINTSGGNGGVHAPDTVTFEAFPGLPGAGGNIYIYGKVGTVTSRGGNGHAGGAAGDVALYGSSTTLSIDASGGLDLCTIALSCHTDVSSGEGGYVRVYPGTTVNGNITANGGENNGVDLADLYPTGSGGKVYVGSTVTGSVTSTGGNTYDAQVGNGGKITVDISGVVSGTINASTGISTGNGDGAIGGVVIVYGTAQDIYSRGYGFSGGRGGSVQILGTVNDIFTNNTSTSPFDGVGGGSILIEPTGVVNSITNSGGLGTNSNGIPGFIIVKGSVAGTITANGAHSDGPHKAGTGANITIFDGASVNFVYALGGNYTGVPGANCSDGGDGGFITVGIAATYDPTRIFVTGGTGDICGTNGSAGTIDY